MNQFRSDLGFLRLEWHFVLCEAIFPNLFEDKSNALFKQTSTVSSHRHKKYAWAHAQFHKVNCCRMDADRCCGRRCREGSHKGSLVVAATPVVAFSPEGERVSVERPPLNRNVRVT